MPHQPSSTSAPVRVLFVCLGNICRSPLAEGIFRHLSRQSDPEYTFEADSAGTGSWHVGEPPDPRSAEVAARHGIPLEGVARQIRLDDFHDFDLILAMDHDNLQEIERLRGSSETRATLALLREFDSEAEGDLNVPDPYYGGPDGFERVFELVHRSCRALLDELRRDGAVGE